MDSPSLYEDAARDVSSKEENGYLSYEMYNRMVKIASNRLLNYITGDSANQALPISYSTQKAKDFIAFLITKFPSSIVDGIIERPADYYTYDNLYILSLSQSGCEDDNTDCDTDSPTAEVIETPVEMMDGQQFNVRRQTYIKGLKPSPTKPICKMVGNTIEFLPKELGSCKLEYIRYPEPGVIRTMVDPIYNDIVADPATSTDCEWGEWARGILVYLIAQEFSIHVRENALFQMTEANKPKV